MKERGSDTEHGETSAAVFGLFFMAFTIVIGAWSIYQTEWQMSHLKNVLCGEEPFKCKVRIVITYMFEALVRGIGMELDFVDWGVQKFTTE